MVKSCQQLLCNIYSIKNLHYHKRNEKQQLLNNDKKSPISIKTQFTDDFIFYKSKRTFKKKINLRKKIRVEGHRGSGILYAENTIQSFANGIELGLDSIELDVWFSKDNKIVVVHGTDDHTLQLIDGSFKKIIDMTYQEMLEQYTIEEGQKIPLLLNVLELCKGKCRVNIELKGDEENLCEEILKLCIQVGIPSVFVQSQKKGMQLSVYFDFNIIENHQIYKRLIDLEIDVIITNQPNFLINFIKTKCT
ncbi:hypothetical protein IMG5_127000 [Ichthyophthirius multifiliis]|uniref:GP-PDE domain-containing protein n=1 Tax=Ichthyophthirius multifiliis TaxID=5932 RepID=G0QVV6_ICHMU|nr:hypothetical protein IMG5_127000 [Ichthyophthirius multifiliis]EGR30651.1 hypothetical protein IMG5_127000 [Ichthyophthirius multifiliis]|eukprot:XP_004032238.1 hypothetical protein IMG5_127000 [Ichthyophthirius multifiliis]